MKHLYQCRKRNIIVKENKHERKCQRSLLLRKTTLLYLVELGGKKRFGSRHPLGFWSWVHLVVARLYQVVTLGSFGRIVCEPSAYDSLLLRGVARWIPSHERNACTISQRGSYHPPFAKMFFKRGFTRVRQSDGRGGWRQRVTRLIHQTFTQKYQRIVLVPRHVYTREIHQEYFQERPLCHSLPMTFHDRFPMKLGMLMLQDKEVLKT